MSLIRKLLATVALALISTSLSAQTPSPGGGQPGLGGRPRVTDNAIEIILDALNDGAKTMSSIDTEVAAAQEVLGQMAEIEFAGAVQAADDVMALFGESYEPVPPFTAADGVFNLPFAPRDGNGTVGPVLTSLEQGSALIDTLVLGELSVDTSTLPPGVQQASADLTNLGVTAQFVYAARFASTADPSQTFAHFGFAYEVQFQGQTLVTFAPLGSALLVDASLPDYVQVFADASGLNITVLTTQNTILPPPSGSGGSNAALDECLEAAGSNYEAALENIAAGFQAAKASINQSAASSLNLMMVSAAATVGIYAVGSLLSVLTAGLVGIPAGAALAGAAQAAGTLLTGAANIVNAAAAMLGQAQDDAHTGFCAASQAAGDALCACFDEHTASFDKGQAQGIVAAKLASMGC